MNLFPIMIFSVFRYAGIDKWGALQ